MADVQCFFIEPTGVVEQFARVECPCGHERRWFIGRSEDVAGEEIVKADWGEVEWGERCPQCERPYDFDDDDAEAWRSTSMVRQYRRTDTGEVGTISGFGPGAMWEAPWYQMPGPDGRCLVVRLPNGHDWCIDSAASNCTRRGEPHQCWVRHGEPPKLTIDKNGDTCAAGAGSILSGDYHGFLIDGKLVSC